MLSFIVTTLFVLVCFFLLATVLLQQGRGGDIAAAFGGGGSQTAFGARQGATVLTRATTVLGALFILTALALTIIGQRGPGSVVSGVRTPGTAPAQTVPVPGSESPAAPGAPAGTEAAPGTTPPPPKPQ
jgi:preprotein translocase subunit SecG